MFFQREVMMKPAGTRTVGILAGMLFLVAGLAGQASAQMLQSTDRAFVGISFGGQTKARTFTVFGSQPVYDETATFESTVGIGADGVFDINGGVRVRSNVGVGISFSRYSDTSTGALTASIPDPVLFDSPRSASVTASGLKHSESQLHLSAYWLQPMTDKIDVSAYAGPTFFSVKQDLVSGINVAAGASTIASVSTTAVDETTVGLHAGVDVRYLIIKNAGVGAFLRYTAGRVDVPVIDGGRMEVGGFQYGVGLRYRF